MSDPQTPNVDAVVIGAGFGGIYMLHKLRNELGLKIAMGNFHGLQDEFMKIIISTIDKGDDSVVITTRKGDEG